MLQSSIPRGFIAPSLNYLTYYNDDLHYGAPWALPMDPSCTYGRLDLWDLSRPLDLSLKPSTASQAGSNADGARNSSSAGPKPEPAVCDVTYYPHHKSQALLATPQSQIHAPMTPPSTPSPPNCPRRKFREENQSPTPKLAEKGLRPKKKHARRLKFDEDTSSPVSGTVILGPDEALVIGDIDPAFNIVEVTDEARAELAKIENRLGPYQCKLCRQLHDDAFQLAQHRCARIAHVEYRCPECDKRFSCPANLASHRRWHKPRNGELAMEVGCSKCEAKFSRQAALRKHLASQHCDAEVSEVSGANEVSEVSEAGEIGELSEANTNLAANLGAINANLTPNAGIGANLGPINTNLASNGVNANLAPNASLANNGVAASLGPINANLANGAIGPLNGNLASNAINANLSPNASLANNGIATNLSAISAINANLAPNGSLANNGIGTNLGAISAINANLANGAINANLASNENFKAIRLNLNAISNGKLDKIAARDKIGGLEGRRGEEA